MDFEEVHYLLLFHVVHSFCRSPKYHKMPLLDFHTCACSSGGRNLPRSLLGSTVGGDSESGVFAVPTTLPPNSSRHNKLFSPNKEAELALRQQLDSISVRWISVCVLTLVTQTFILCFGKGANFDFVSLSWYCIYFMADAVRYFPAQTEKTSKQTTSETTRGSGKRIKRDFFFYLI